MKCREARKKISAYLDCELDDSALRRLESHLDQCADCREALGDLQGVNDILRSMPMIELGPHFAARMVRMVNETATMGEIGDLGRSSLLKRLSLIAVDFVNMVSSVRSPSTGTLDEFSDCPPLSMGHIYFKLIAVNG